MVDASLQMSIVNLLRDLRDHFGVTVIYITHDLATAYYISNRIVIMQKGHIVEMGPAQAILEAPEHPYAQLLKNSVLSIDDAGHGRCSPPTAASPRPPRSSRGAGCWWRDRGAEGTRYEVGFAASTTPTTAATPSRCGATPSRRSTCTRARATPYNYEPLQLRTVATTKHCD